MPCWVWEGVIDCLVVGGAPSNPLTTNEVTGLGYMQPAGPCKEIVCTGCEVPSLREHKQPSSFYKAVMATSESLN